MRKPLIGITLDWEEGRKGTFSAFPWYALRQNYCDAVQQAGGVPLALPHNRDNLETLLDTLDGLIVSGGKFDVNPGLFGATEVHQNVTTKEERTRFEIELLQAALQKKMPIFGICGGMQILNVVCGGTLIQHIPDAVPNALTHEQPNPRDEPGHVVSIKDNTQLQSIVNEKELPVNSAHHQAVERLGATLRVNAVAPDGIVEGFEKTDHPFCIGVQWHPEFSISEGDKALYQAFCEAATAFGTRKCL